MASIFGRAERIGRTFYTKYGKSFYEANFRVWRDYPVHYLSVLCLVPALYIALNDADSRYMEAEKLAGPPVYRVPRRETVPSLEELEAKYGKV
ncbi:hypothetical protein ACHWQZ_G005647 [Mnemiopsis leidyi]